MGLPPHNGHCRHDRDLQGVRESAQSWRELLVDLKARGLSIAPEMATGDGALGFWKALDEVSPMTRHQRCTVHKTANVLDKLPKSVQPAAKADLREVWTAPDRATAEAAIATFANKYGAKYDKAVTCPVKDRDALLTFYDFPAEHWDHLRTSNPIESVFATVRHRTVRTIAPWRSDCEQPMAEPPEGALSQDTARLMAFKLVTAAAKTWHRLKGGKPVAQGRPGRHLHQRCRGHQHASTERRLITASPKLGIALFRKVTNGFRSEWGAETYAAFRSVVSTAKARGDTVLHAVRNALRNQPGPAPG